MHTLVQYGAAEDEMRALHSYEELMLEWMGNFVSRVLFNTGSGGSLGKWRGVLNFCQYVLICKGPVPNK